MEYLKNFWHELVYLTFEMAPYLLLGFLFAGILYAWFPQQKINRYLGKNNLRSVINAALLGVPLPLCSCGVIPTGISFYKNGASKGSTVSFLISTPQTGVDSIMVTWSLLGWPLAIIRPVIAFFTGIFGGFLTNKLEKNKDHNNTSSQIYPNPEEKKRIGFKDMLKYAFVDFLQDIVKWLVIGLIIAAVIAVIVPDDFFTSYLQNDYISMLIILLASIPLYVCATGSVPIAAVLLMKGLSPGAAIVFLMAGPATNAATISVIGNALGRKTLFTYLFSIIAGSLFFGILINELIPSDFFLNAMNHSHHGEHQHEFLPYRIQLLSAIVLTLLLLNGLFRKYILTLFPSAKNKKPGTMPQLSVKVKGMTCNHCKMTVEKNLGKIPGISSVNADIVNNIVHITGNKINIPVIENTLNEIGYLYQGIVNQQQSE